MAGGRLGAKIHKQYHFITDSNRDLPSFSFSNVPGAITVAHSSSSAMSISIDVNFLELSNFFFRSCWARSFKDADCDFTSTRGFGVLPGVTQTSRKLTRDLVGSAWHWIVRTNGRSLVPCAKRQRSGSSDKKARAGRVMAA